MAASKDQEFDNVDNVRNIDITVTLQTLRDDLFKIYSQLFKNVTKDEIVFEELHGGFVNSIMKLSPKNDESKSLIFRTFSMKFNLEVLNKKFEEVARMREKNAEMSVDENNNTIINDKKPEGENGEQAGFTKMIFNRETEFKVMNVVSKHGLCKRVYARYNNGICYGYTKGVTLSGPLMLTIDFLNEMASKLAQFHSIKYDVPGIVFKTHFERLILQTGATLQVMVNKIDDELGDKLKEYPFNQLPTSRALAVFEEKIIKLFNEIGFGRIVFCHNDVNQKNIIWDSQQRILGFIDFEMSMNNYVAMEIGYLFGCFPGHFLCDYNKDFFPNIDYRRRFVKKYLEEFNELNEIKLTDREFEKESNELLIRSDLGALLLMLRWAMAGKFFDKRPDMFNNEELVKKKKETENFCTLWSSKIFKLYENFKDDVFARAEQLLKSKNS